MFPDVEENLIMKQMQTENNGEAELETEGPGGIFFNSHFHCHYYLLFSPPDFSRYDFVAPPDPLTHGLQKEIPSLAILIENPCGCFTSHGVSGLLPCMVAAVRLL